MDCAQSRRVSPRHDDKSTRHPREVAVWSGNVARIRAADVLPFDVRESTSSTVV